jgi:hypothetical protein
MEKILSWVVLGVGVLLLLIVFINGIADIAALNNGGLGRIFNNGRYLLPINEIIQAVFWKETSGGAKTVFDLTGLFGMAMTDGGTWEGASFSEGFFIKNRVFEFSALYEGGLFAFLALLVMLVFAFISLRKFLHTEEKIKPEKVLLAALFVGWFLYESLESDSYPVVYTWESSARYCSPLFENNLFLIMVFLLGFSYTPIFSFKEKAEKEASLHA